MNVAKGFGYEVYGLGRAGLSHGMDLAKAGRSFGVWVVTEGANPYAIMSDPDGWLSRGIGKLGKVSTAGLWAGLWAATELAPMGGNPIGGLTVIGLGFGLGGWAAGGDAPTLNWAGGGIVFEFGNSPCNLGTKGMTWGRTIIYKYSPDQYRNHEFQHVKQYAALGDIGYLGGHLLSMGLSCLISGDYASVNPLDIGPWGEQGTFGGEQRPWPWRGGAKGGEDPRFAKCSNKHPLKGQ